MPAHDRGMQQVAVPRPGPNPGVSRCFVGSRSLSADDVHHVGMKLRSVPADRTSQAGEVLRIAQVGVDPVHDVDHEGFHFDIGYPRKLGPGDFAIWRDDLDVGVVAGGRAWGDAGVQVLQLRVSYAGPYERLSESLQIATRGGGQPRSAHGWWIL